MKCMKFKEVRKKYRDAGWEKLKQNGSHEQGRKGTERETIAGKDSDDVPRGTLKTLLNRLK